MKKVSLYFVIIAVLAISCDDDVDKEAVKEKEAQFVELYCKSVTQCCESDKEKADCVEKLSGGYTDVPPGVSINWSKLESCLDFMISEYSAGCGNTVDRIREDELCTTDMYSGTGTSGDSCYGDFMCRRGYYCKLGTGCQMRVREGGECTNSSPTMCQKGLACIESTCQQTRDIGEDCTSPSHCGSKIDPERTCINNICAYKLENGEDCSEERDWYICRSENCNYETKLCAPLTVTTICEDIN